MTSSAFAIASALCKEVIEEVGGHHTSNELSSTWPSKLQVYRDLLKLMPHNAATFDKNVLLDLDGSAHHIQTQIIACWMMIEVEASLQVM